MAGSTLRIRAHRAGRRRTEPLRALHRPAPARPTTPTSPSAALEREPTTHRRRHRIRTVVGIVVGATLLAVLEPALLSTTSAGEPRAAATVEATELRVDTVSSNGSAGLVFLPGTARTRLSLASPFEGVRGLIRAHFGPDTTEAIMIAQCESSFRPLAIGTNRDGTQDHGLFQINDVHRADFEAVTGASWDARYELQRNVAFAAWLFRRDGWRPWTCRRVLSGRRSPG